MTDHAGILIYEGDEVEIIGYRKEGTGTVIYDPKQALPFSVKTSFTDPVPLDRCCKLIKVLTEEE